MFADRARIIIKSGKGGDGHVSFRREKFVPNGGPDGGDGGKGGDIIFEVDEGLNTLTDYRHRRKFAAQAGEEGGKKNCHGKNGADLILKVPEGTVIKDAESGKVIADMSGDNKRQIILTGGRGGLGNQHYATSTMQAPKYAQPGGESIEIEVQLELKVIADVGLVGFPNVGKSTFLSRVTNAKPKIANYHFTTLNPNLGVVDLHPRVHEITIIPRGQAGGYTMYLPEKDRSYVTKGEMFEDIVSSLGGRVAEQLILEDISTGASNDLQQATNIARQMITKYGFSERLGPVVYGTSQEETFLGRDFTQGKGYSESTAAEIDGEMRDIIDEAYETCRRTLTEHIDQLHALAQALMEREKLNEQEFNTVMAGGKLPPRDGDEPAQETAAPAAPVETAEPAESAEPAEQAEQAVLGEEMPDPAQDALQENE